MIEFMELIENNYESIVITVTVFIASTLTILYFVMLKKSKNSSLFYTKIFEEASKSIEDMCDIHTEKDSSDFLELKTEFVENNTLEKLIKNHHEQALQQAAIQFWCSIGTSIAGFIFVIVMIIISKDQEWYRYILNSIPSVIIEIVSVLFINQANKLRDRSSDFLNKLRTDRQIEKSIEVADSIEDNILKSKVKAKIALHMSGIDDSVLPVKY